MTKESLTFPAVATAAGTILRVIDSTPSKWLAVPIAVILGGALVVIGWLRTPPADPAGKVEAGLMALLNIGLMWVAILGVAVVSGAVTTYRSVVLSHAWQSRLCDRTASCDVR